MGRPGYHNMTELRPVDSRGPIGPGNSYERNQDGSLPFSVENHASGYGDEMFPLGLPDDRRRRFRALKIPILLNTWISYLTFGTTKRGLWKRQLGRAN